MLLPIIVLGMCCCVCAQVDTSWKLIQNATWIWKQLSREFLDYKNCIIYCKLPIPCQKIGLYRDFLYIVTQQCLLCSKADHLLKSGLEIEVQQENSWTLWGLPIKGWNLGSQIPKTICSFRLFYQHIHSSYLPLCLLTFLKLASLKIHNSFIWGANHFSK